MVTSGWDRGVICDICRLYNYKYKHSRKLVGCNEYLDKNLEVCGCEYAPRKILEIPF